ncbi:uncharacterized protein MYCFIDRAFT_179388 [Pseudocercospora fijiensis CIRAD86]|uniref:Uncharacterized protein n=1 Tax=Pseudocercospora fijiensis (strain CIRAD86) TaxID=383855 RepID=M2YJJ9_PSEFD|nr:uncharacterized protein MYCFIDRAFT_179388 [Pseudocercospora fijiensis CIRAD86]EME77925.1 hypothetical protein MYCFIDRAFT_179388 [Pseudocercospora fijiensis CIRAD86]
MPYGDDVLAGTSMSTTNGVQASGELAEADGGGWGDGMAEAEAEAEADYGVAHEQQQAGGEEGRGATACRWQRTVLARSLAQPSRSFRSHERASERPRALGVECSSKGHLLTAHGMIKGQSLCHVLSRHLGQEMFVHPCRSESAKARRGITGAQNTQRRITCTSRSIAGIDPGPSQPFPFPFEAQRKARARSPRDTTPSLLPPPPPNAAAAACSPTDFASAAQHAPLSSAASHNAPARVMSNPNVDHHFEGDSKLLNATFNPRAEVRSALLALQKELARIEGQPVQVTAEIKFNVSGLNAKEHVYSVNVTDAHFDAAVFARNKASARRSGNASASSPGNPTSLRSALEAEDGAESRPLKRVRTDGDDAALSATLRNGTLSEEATSQKVDEVLNIIKGWRDEWKAQGGWLFDTLNTVNKGEKDIQNAIEKKLETVQDVLGQSINSATASTMSELSNITKLLPWLEHCRKTNADKVQAREEKWRSSSASFHDQARREREEAEKRFEEKLEAQRRLLIKVAEANGIDIDEDDQRSDVSLGEQLTAELNSEALRAERDSRNLASHAHITIDD